MEHSIHNLYRDLDCRVNCPFFEGWKHTGPRPCVAKLKEKEVFCVNQVRQHYSGQTGPEGVENLLLQPVKNRVNVFDRKKQIGFVANGTGIIFRTQS